MQGEWTGVVISLGAVGAPTRVQHTPSGQVVVQVVRLHAGEVAERELEAAAAAAEKEELSTRRTGRDRKASGKGKVGQHLLAPPVSCSLTAAVVICHSDCGCKPWLTCMNDSSVCLSYLRTGTLCRTTAILYWTGSPFPLASVLSAPSSNFTIAGLYYPSIPPTTHRLPGGSGGAISVSLRLVMSVCQSLGVSRSVSLCLSEN